MASAGSIAIETPDKNGLVTGHQLLLLVLSIVFSVITGSLSPFNLYGSKQDEDLILDYTVPGHCPVSYVPFMGSERTQTIAHPSDFILVYKLAFVVTIPIHRAQLIRQVLISGALSETRLQNTDALGGYLLFIVETAQFAASCVVLGLAFISSEHLLDGQAHSIVGLDALQDFYNAKDILCSPTSVAIYITTMILFSLST
ncbi:Hypothetical predicted protein [Lecanosticta acicola]|uniref:Uncharacterized protein n=1 Tax=Lecanosticta acicola TaxID=111012 RepID=A0AAI8Z152_9PEZI|nr:Hypothetical predicted protein [Lecanosticta acicola]